MQKELSIVIVETGHEIKLVVNLWFCDSVCFCMYFPTEKGFDPKQGCSLSVL